MTKAFLEIGALFEEHWTGIPTVVAAIARAALKDRSVDWGFIFDTVRIPREFVAKMLQDNTGLGGLAEVERLAWNRQFISTVEAQSAVGVYTNIKPMRRFFGKEAMVVYDLSPLLTPEYHNIDTINHFSDRIRADIRSSDHIFCISNSVMSDVRDYFSFDPKNMSLIKMGVELDLAHVSAAHARLNHERYEPYVVILGTLEPRKNGRLMLRYLQDRPDFASRFRIVFVGRDGWLDAKRELLDAVRQAGVPMDRVMFTGYMTEAEKVALLFNAAFCVYPSFFEGYGLPVLEAATLGKITVCSNSSSMPEVSPENCLFFDPVDLDDFGGALRKAELLFAQMNGQVRPVEDIARARDARSWSHCYPDIARWVESAY